MAGRNTKLTPALQKKIVKVLKTGATIADACAYVDIHVDTFYEWLKRGAANESPFSEFSEAVRRAQGNAKAVAIEAIHLASKPYKQTSKTVETYTETKIGRDGQPYEYKRSTERDTVTLMMGDWRAAVEYLKRRYPDEWSEKRILELGLSPDLLKRLEEVAKLADLPASRLFEEMLNAVAAELEESRAESAGSSTDGG